MFLTSFKELNGLVENFLNFSVFHEIFFSLLDEIKVCTFVAS